MPNYKDSHLDRRALVDYYQTHSLAATAQAFETTINVVRGAAKALGYNKREELAKRHSSTCSPRPRGTSAFAIVAQEFATTPVHIRQIVNKALRDDVALVRGLALDDLEAQGLTSKGSPR